MAVDIVDELLIKLIIMGWSPPVFVDKLWITGIIVNKVYKKNRYPQLVHRIINRLQLTFL